MVVAHNAGFDVGVLRREYARLGQELPDLPVLSAPCWQPPTPTTR